MRLQTFIAFGFGFSMGVLCLAAGLWWTGRITPQPRQTPVQTVEERQRLVDLPHNPPPVVPPPVQAPAQSLSPDRLAIPITGVDPSKLRTNFDEIRGGHRHEALDIMAPRGTPVMAVAQGNVVKLFTSKQGGLTVYQFDDSQTMCYYYAHLDRYAAELKEGTLLRKGDVFGYVGSTGDASPEAPHLHFAVFRLGPEKQWWKGTPIDPLPLFQ
jgi:murein DD-endopeptidase MepM/ murein hydrolase activator NlpD